MTAALVILGLIALVLVLDIAFSAGRRQRRASVDLDRGEEWYAELEAVNREVDPAVGEAMAHARARREFLERHPELWR